MEPGLMNVKGKSKPPVSQAQDRGAVRFKHRFDGQSDRAKKNPARATFTAAEQIHKK